MWVLIKKIVSFIIVVIFLSSPLCVNAAWEPDVIRVYKKVITDEQFSELFNEASKTFDAYGVTEEYVTDKLKTLISDVINTALADKKSGKLTKGNAKTEMKPIIIQHILALDATVFAIITDNLSEEELNKSFAGEFPKRFNSLYSVLYTELWYILGYTERGVEIIFDDMQGYEWANEAVDTLFNAKIVNGMSDFLYCPKQFVTREQFAKLLCAAFDIEKGELEVSFSDADKNAWYYPYIEIMASNGLINGIGNGIFGVGSNITRQDMAVMMYRVGEKLKYFSLSPTNYPFNDSGLIAPYAIKAVNTLREQGIVNGDNMGNFNPTSNATRAEAAQIIYNMYKLK